MNNYFDEDNLISLLNKMDKGTSTRVFFIEKGMTYDDLMQADSVCIGCTKIKCEDDSTKVVLCSEKQED